MSQANTNSFFDDQLLAYSRPLDNMSPAERLEYENNAALGPKIDPEISSLSGVLGPTLTGAMSSFIGKTGAYLGSQLDAITSDDEAYVTPLNFEKRTQVGFAATAGTAIGQLGPIGKSHLPSESNNIESITEDLMGVDPNTHGWLLSSSSYGEYRDRLDLARIASPSFAAQGNAAGAALGFTADTAAIIAMSMAIEPLAFAGYGQRFIQSGQKISALRSAERFGNMRVFAEEAAEAAEMVGRLSGMGRYAVLGLAEEIAIKSARYGIDPTFDPDSKSLAFDAAFSMGLGGAIGGFAARSYAADQIQKYAENFYHQARLGSGTIVNFHTPLAFVSTAAADRNLLDPVFKPAGETIDSIADEAFKSLEATGREFQPGTQSISLPVLQGEGATNLTEDVGASLIAGEVKLSAYGDSMYTPANEEFLTVLLNNGRNPARTAPSPTASRNIAEVSRTAAQQEEAAFAAVFDDGLDTAEFESVTSQLRAAFTKGWTKGNEPKELIARFNRLKDQIQDKLEERVRLKEQEVERLQKQIEGLSGNRRTRLEKKLRKARREQYDAEDRLNEVYAGFKSRFNDEDIRERLLRGAENLIEMQRARAGKISEKAGQRVRNIAAKSAKKPEQLFTTRNIPVGKTPLERTAQRMEGLPSAPKPSGVILTNRRGGKQLSAGLNEDIGIERNLYEGGQGQGTGIEIELDSSTVSGDFIPSSSLFSAAEEGDVAFRYSGDWENLNKSIRSISISPSADAAQASRIKEALQKRGWNMKTLKDGTEVFTPQGRGAFVVKGQDWKAQVNGVESSILNIAAEIRRRGGKVDQNTTRAIARALFAANSEGLKGAAFEEKVWSTISTLVDPAVMERIKEARRLGNSPPIRGLDEAFDSLVLRRETMDGLWSVFNTGLDEAGDVLPGTGLSAPLENPSQASLILQVANEVRRRGGNVTREVFEEIVEDLRELMKNPPKRVNSKGKTVLDARQRLARVADIINRRVPDSSGKISIPKALQASVKAFSRRLELSRKAITSAEEARAARAEGKVAEGASGEAGKVDDTSDADSLDGALRMQEEIALLDKYDTLGPIAKFFNQAAILLRFENPAARMAGLMGFNARRAMRTKNGVDVAQGQTVFEQTTYEMTGHLAAGLTKYRNGYVRFALGKGAGDKISMMDSLRAAFGKGSRQKIDEFNKAVIEQLRSGKYNHASDGVNDTAKQFREVFNKIHEAASQAKLKGFQQGANLDYLPRLWRWDKIARLGTTPEGRRALEQVLEKALGGTTGTRQVLMDDGTIENLGDVAAAAKVLADRLINLANKSDLAPVLDTEDEIAKAINGLLGPVSPSGTARTPFGRPRIILDEAGEVVTAADHLNSGKNSLSIADLTMDDLPAILRKYTVSVFGAIGEKRFIDRFNEQLAHFGIKASNGSPVQIETVDEMISMINKIGNMDPTLGGSMTPNEVDALREIVAAIRYEPLHRSSNQLGPFGRLGDKVSGVMLPLGYLATGGAFGLVAASETSRIIGTLGLKTTLKQVPVLKEMLANWDSMDEGPKNFASMVDHAFHPATDRLRRVLMMQVQNQYGGERNILERGLNSLSNFFSDVTLLAPVTSFTQHLMAASTVQHFYDVSKGLAKRMDDATIRTLGLEPEQYDELLDFVGNNAVTKARGNSTRVVDLNNIHDVRMDNLRAFVDRAVRTRIQDMPTRGDFHKIGFTFLGRLLTQFRGFNLKGVDNFMLQNLSRVRRGDNATRLRVGQEIMFTAVFSAIVQYSRNLIDAQSYHAAGNEDKAEEIEKNLLGVGGFIRGGAVGPSEFFLPMFAVDTAWTELVSDDPLFSSYRYSGLGLYGFPAASFASKGYGVAKDVFGAAVAKPLGIEDKERDITERTVHKFRLMLPFQNFGPVKHLFNIAEEEIAEEYRLLERQPRRARKVEG